MSSWSVTSIERPAYPGEGNRNRPYSYLDRVGREKYSFGRYGYGKSFVKLLHVRRDGDFHAIREYEVATFLRLNSQRDYLEGDNRDIVATDSQKNTVYVLAKKHGITSPEDFGILLCKHFLATYGHIEEVRVQVEEYPWQRLSVDGVPHNHAFAFVPSSTRVATVSQARHGKLNIRGGLRNFRLLKTTQSAFVDFVADGYRTLKDADDRIFSTIVESEWEFSTGEGVDFDQAFENIKTCILHKFAGPADKGVFSPSVQNTLYLAEKMILDKVPQIERIEMSMPNKHYFTVDMSMFPSSVVQGENKEVFMPVDKPSGLIYAELKRNNIRSKL